MTALRAHVENGRIIVDDPTDLPDGTELRLVPLNDGDDMGSAERTEFLQALDEAIDDEEAGRMSDAVVLADRLLAKP